MTDKDDADQYRLKQAEKMLAVYREVHGRPASTMEELSNWATSAQGKATLLTRDGKIIPD